MPGATRWGRCRAPSRRNALLGPTEQRASLATTRRTSGTARAGLPPTVAFAEFVRGPSTYVCTEKCNPPCDFLHAPSRDVHIPGRMFAANCGFGRSRLRKDGVACGAGVNVAMSECSLHGYIGFTARLHRNGSRRQQLRPYGDGAVQGAFVNPPPGRRFGSRSP